MKLSLLSIASLLSLTVSAQTLTQANHAPAANESYTRYQCDSTGITLGTSGANQVWNFSSLITHSTVVADYAVRSNTNTAYNPADVTVNVGPNADNYYFKSSTSDLKYYGGNFLVGGFSAVLNFSTPGIAAIYPMNLNSSSSNTVAGTIVINGSFNGTFDGNTGLFADGTGTLVLASKTFNDVIKVTSSQFINATLSIGTATIMQVKVDYYSVGNPKAALVSITTSTIASSLSGTPSSQTVVTVLKDYTTVGLNDLTNENEAFTMYPNPANSVANFHTTNLNAYKVQAYDMTGKIVLSSLFENTISKLNLQGLSNGVYLYTISDKNNQVLKSGKFNVEK